jgi:hypothetical protein
MPVESPATNGVTRLCVEPHDLCASKLLAGRDRQIASARSTRSCRH